MDKIIAKEEKQDIIILDEGLSTDYIIELRVCCSVNIIIYRG